MAQAFGKPSSFFVGDDFKILEDGTVKGTIHYVKGFTEFSPGTPALQEGNFAPVQLTGDAGSGTTMDIKKNGEDSKMGISYDSDLVLRVDSGSTTFTIQVDGEEVITLNFAQATLEGADG